MLILLSNTCAREDSDRQYAEFFTVSILKSITIPPHLLRGILEVHLPTDSHLSLPSSSEGWKLPGTSTTPGEGCSPHQHRHTALLGHHAPQTTLPDPAPSLTTDTSPFFPSFIPYYMYYSVLLRTLHWPEGKPTACRRPRGGARCVPSRRDRSHSSQKAKRRAELPAEQRGKARQRTQGAQPASPACVLVWAFCWWLRPRTPPVVAAAAPVLSCSPSARRALHLPTSARAPAPLPLLPNHLLPVWTSSEPPLSSSSSSFLQWDNIGLVRFSVFLLQRLFSRDINIIAAKRLKQKKEGFLSGHTR